MTKQTYILIDSLNLAHRARFVTAGDLDTKIGMSLHIIFNSIKKAYRDMNGTHVVFCQDGRSWRKDVCTSYKANRKAAQLAKTARELEEERVYFEAFDEFVEFLTKQTNATVLKAPGAEADDLIATWIDLHPNSDHIILSSDSDFVQLINHNVSLYNGITEFTYTHNGVYDSKGQKHAFEVDTNGKIKIKESNPNFVPPSDWQDFSLFVKCVRGDKSDNVFPAYPGARFRGTKNRTGITEAYEDRNNGGYNWNNFMLQTWQDHHGQTRTVKQEYEKNRLLIDLRAQPQPQKEAFVEAVANAVNKPHVQGVGVYLLKFCGRWDLQQIARAPEAYSGVLNAPYQGELKQ